jgi:MFS family permease
VLALAVVAGLAWAAFNAALLVLVSFAPGLLMARGATLVQAGLLASVAIWISLVSVPAGGWLADRARGRDRVIVAGCLACATAMAAIPLVEPAGLGLVLAGVTVGLAPGAIMTLLPETVPAAHLAGALGVYYTVYYLGVALAQPAAGLVRDLTGSPAAPLVFAAALMAATVVGLAAFRRIGS